MSIGKFPLPVPPNHPALRAPLLKSGGEYFHFVLFVYFVVIFESFAVKSLKWRFLIIDAELFRLLGVYSPS